MENLRKNLESDIKVLVRPLKDDIDEVIEVLRRRLTKKEWKYYKLRIENDTKENMCKELNCDKKRLEEISKQTILKLNQEKIKSELMV